LRNVAVALANTRNRSHVPALEPLADDPDPVVREHARWALRRLGNAGAPR
jgi:epoxyqueuosine reductase